MGIYTFYFVWHTRRKYRILFGNIRTFLLPIVLLTQTYLPAVLEDIVYKEVVQMLG
jgi:hypothetical protein